MPVFHLDRVIGHVGIEMRISRLEGKRKLSQNRSAADVAGVITGLDLDPAVLSPTVADSMRRHSAPTASD